MKCYSDLAADNTTLHYHLERNEKCEDWTEHIFKFITLKKKNKIVHAGEKNYGFILTDQALHRNHFYLNDKLSFGGINEGMKGGLSTTTG